MATPIGSRAERLSRVRALRTVKGRREQGRFAFEGSTLLGEAHRSGTAIAELYVTQAAYDATPLARELDREGTPTFIVAERSASTLSDVETPSGIFAIAATASLPLAELMREDGILLVIADLNDPGNAGTLLRSADAFGVRGVVFGRMGVDPYHPKVVRGAMGALFRLALGVGDPSEVAAAASAGDFTLVGLRAGASRPRDVSWAPRTALVVGNERHGLGSWERLCDCYVGIPMAGPAESLNAAIAGSIALYEATGGRPPSPS